jgi:uncharacterized membrane protein
MTFALGREKALENKIVQFFLRLGLFISFIFLVAGMIFSSEQIIRYGLLVLAATPAFRILTLIFIWSRERDWVFVAISAFVLITLIVAALSGH